MQTKLLQNREIRNYALRLAVKSLSQMLTQLSTIWVSISILSGMHMEYINNDYFFPALVFLLSGLIVYLYSTFRTPKYTMFVNKICKQFNFKKPLVIFAIRYQTTIFQLFFWHLILFAVSIELGSFVLLFSIAYKLVFQNSSEIFKRILSSVPMCLFIYIFFFVILGLFILSNDLNIILIIMILLVIRQAGARHALILRMHMKAQYKSLYN